MKTLLMISFCAALGLLCWQGANSMRVESVTTYPTRVSEEMIYPKGVFGLLAPYGREVLVGPQLAETEMIRLVEDFPIDRVIRLSLEDKALQKLDTARQRKTLERLGVELHLYNIEGRGGKLNAEAMAEINELLRKGRVYVHCLHGQHRAKAVAGDYYARYGYKFATIVDLLEWGDVVADDRYQRYTGYVRDLTDNF